MDYPFIHNGDTEGKLSVTQEGLFTVFELTSRYTPELLRVNVYGNGEPFYLGIPQPRGKGLYLRRRLTRREMLAVPKKIEYAACERKPAEKKAVSGASEGSAWIHRSDGTLTSEGFIAIPAALGSVPRGAVVKNIGGRTYMLFRT
ncbi:MAG: hypothetical protein Q4E35_07115 [Eubacteriales bacterium]|nr:hypothetical protein [Eubacteriales bacterium]